VVAGSVATVVAFGALLAAYLGAVVLIAGRGAPRLRPVELTVVALIATALPLVSGAAWFGGTVFLAALIGLSAPAPRALLAIAAATVVAVVTGPLSDAPAPQSLSVPLLTALAGVVVVVVVRQVVLTRELARVTAEAERLRLARELHDSVKQHAFIAAMELGAARARSGRDQHLDNAAEAVAEVQRRLAGVLDELRPAQGELAPALRGLVEDWSQRTGLPVDLDLAAPDGTPADPLLPVAAEALTNIERHAAASRVTVSLQPGGLLIRDDGVGFDVAGSGHGLRGMRERLAACGGSVDVRSGPSGTAVHARCPR
jgi:signal transduction histidine kinase